MMILSEACLPGIKLHWFVATTFSIRFFNLFATTLVTIFTITLQRAIWRIWVIYFWLLTFGMREIRDWFRCLGNSPFPEGHSHEMYHRFTNLMPEFLKEKGRKPSGPAAFMPPIWNVAFLYFQSWYIPMEESQVSYFECGELPFLSISHHCGLSHI